MFWKRYGAAIAAVILAQLLILLCYRLFLYDTPPRESGPTVRVAAAQPRTPTAQVFPRDIELEPKVFRAVLEPQAPPPPSVATEPVAPVPPPNIDAPTPVIPGSPPAPLPPGIPAFPAPGPTPPSVAPQFPSPVPAVPQSPIPEEGKFNKGVPGVAPPPPIAPPVNVTNPSETSPPPKVGAIRWPSTPPPPKFEVNPTEDHMKAVAVPLISAPPAPKPQLVEQPRIAHPAPVARVKHEPTVIEPIGPCPWTLCIEVVDGRTVLSARIKNEVQFRIYCDHLELQAPRGHIHAAGNVEISSDGLEATCDKLSIAWSEDAVLLEGQAFLKCRRDGQNMELRAPKLSLRLSVAPGGIGRSGAGEKRQPFRDSTTDTTEPPLHGEPPGASEAGPEARALLTAPRPGATNQTHAGLVTGVGVNKLA